MGLQGFRVKGEGLVIGERGGPHDNYEGVCERRQKGKEEGGGMGDKPREVEDRELLA